MEHGKIRVQINCQKAKTVEMELSINAGIREADGISAQVLESTVNGCQLGQLQLAIENDPMGENANLALEKPVSLYIPLADRPEKITAMHLFNPWWTRPAFVERFQDIPDQTQAAFFQYKDRCACFVPMVGNKFKAYLSGGTDTELRLEMTARIGGQHRLDEPVYAYAEGTTVAEAVHRVFAWLAEEKGIRLREERRIPEMFRYLGWCSWDAFYADISEDKLRQKADELHEKQVPVRWMLFDDGWLSVENKRLTAFEPDRTKFPDGFKGLTRDIRGQGDIQWFGVWHALGGYWNGIDPDSELAVREAANLCRTANGTVVPSPKTGDRFYDDWYRLLRDQGIDFVKVDGQSAVPFYFENTLPVGEAARGINEALERGAYRMDNAIINCMGMAMENILARPASAISRSSNDFVPKEEGSFSEHLLENAYNAIYHNELYCCDWDMFWTRHEDAAKHSLLRAISGGPVYFSDRIGDTVPEVLKPLAYADGRLLMMDRSAKPTEDCVFTDPTKEGVLKLHNAAPWGADRKGGGIAAYNLTNRRQTVAFTPADIPGLDEAERYWVYDFLQKKAQSLAKNEQYQDALEADGFAWYVILPQSGSGSCLGLLDKYVGFTAVESVQENDGTAVIVLHESGTVGWASEKAPKKVIAGTKDVTANVKKSGGLYILPLPETGDKAVISITW